MSEQGGIGHTWFRVDVTSEPVGGLGHSWFVVDVVSVPVEPGPDPEPIVHEGGTGTTFFGAPIVPEDQLEFRYAGRIQQPELVPLETRFSGQTAGVRPLELRFSGQTNACREVAFVFAGTREPSYQWVQLTREDEELLAVLLAS